MAQSAEEGDAANGRCTEWKERGEKTPGGKRVLIIGIRVLIIGTRAPIIEHNARGVAQKERAADAREGESAQPGETAEADGVRFGQM